MEADMKERLKMARSMGEVILEAKKKNFSNLLKIFLILMLFQ